MTQDQKSLYLGTEKLSKLIIKFSVPCVLSLLVNALYNIVDQIFIGNSELSTLGNAATGIVFPLFIVAQAFAWWVGDGCAAHLNISQGKKDTKDATKAMGTGMVLTFAISIVLMAIIFGFKTQILTVFGATENTMPYAVEYLNVIVAFFPIYMMVNMMNSVVRADGAPQWSMASVVAGTVANLILDPVFIFGFKWGMFGAALATVIGQTLSFVITLLYFFRTKTFKLSAKDFVPDFAAFSTASKLGMSSLITQMSIVCLALVTNICFAKYGAISSYGADIPLAIIAIQSKVFTVVINIIVGVVLGCQPIVSYNMGAKNYGRVKDLFKKLLEYTLVIGAVATVIIELMPKALIGLFGQPTNIPNPDEYWAFGEKFFRIFMMFVLFTCVQKMASIFLQAAGKSGSAVVASLVRDIICYVPLAIILPAAFNGLDSMLWASPISDLAGIIVTAILAAKFLGSLNESVEKSKDETVLQPSKPGAIITIAREHGSSGKQIGKLVAEKLGIPFYYKEITALAAKESGLHKEFISDININSPAALNSLYLSTDVIQQAIVAQDRVINAIADQGSCVIVGRAADYVLRNREHLVRIFIYANEDYKVKRLGEIYGDSEADAKRNIRRSNHARSAYYRNISGKPWGRKENYELMIDSSVGVDASVDAICRYIESIR